MMENQQDKKRVGPLRTILALVGPGLFLIGYNIGTGSVTTMASAGSKWGMQLTWTVLLSSFFVFIGIVLFGRYTLATGDTILYAIRRRLPAGTAISLFIMGSLILAEFAGVAGLTAISVDLLVEWCKAVAGIEFDALRTIITVVICAVTFGILWNGKYAFLETLLAVLVSLMGLCFLITAAMVVPSWRDIFVGLKPAIPDEPDAMLIVAAMSGTTFSAAMLYCRSITLKAKGWGLEHERRAWLDAVVSAVSMFVLSIAVMMCAAGTLYVVGHPVEETIDMVRTLEPLAGNLAISVFVVGLVGAGLSSLLPTILIAPWLISDYQGKAMDPKTWTSRLFVVLGVAFGLVGPLGGPYLGINLKPVQLMITTMALLAIVLPFSVIAITALLNQKHVGKYKNSWLLNLACLAALIFSVIMSYCGIVEIINKLK